MRILYSQNSTEYVSVMTTCPFEEDEENWQCSGFDFFHTLIMSFQWSQASFKNEINYTKSFDRQTLLMAQEFLKYD